MSYDICLTCNAGSSYQDSSIHKYTLTHPTFGGNQ
jgi:hypothetical protein